MIVPAILRAISGETFEQGESLSQTHVQFVAF
jgi:hypothetical protein